MYVHIYFAAGGWNRVTRDCVHTRVGRGDWRARRRTGRDNQACRPRYELACPKLLRGWETLLGLSLVRIGLSITGWEEATFVPSPPWTFLPGAPVTTLYRRVNASSFSSTSYLVGGEGGYTVSGIYNIPSDQLSPPDELSDNRNRRNSTFAEFSCRLNCNRWILIVRYSYFHCPLALAASALRNVSWIVSIENVWGERGEHLPIHPM